MSRNKKWTEEEISTLKENYKKEWDELLPLLPSRTKAAVKLKMNSLGLFKLKLDEEQKQFILGNYKEMTSREIAKELGYKSNSAIINFLKEEGLQRLSDNWIRKDISKGVDSGFYVEIEYEMDDRRRDND